MGDFVDDCVEVIEDLLELRVVSVAMERHSELARDDDGGGGAWDRNAEILEKRLIVLKKLSQKLPVSRSRVFVAPRWSS